MTALPPRQQLLFDFGWKFQFGHGTDPTRDLGFGYGQGDFAKTGTFDFAKDKFDDSKWRALNLPHDWAVELPFVNDKEQSSHGFKPLGRRYPETSVGWYRREFEIPASDRGRRIWVEFDGAFRDILVFVNGCFIGRNNNGYVPSRFDLTDFLSYGTKNYIVVRVDASFGDGWFYEGAGIYRHAWLMKTDPLHLGRWESTVRAELNGGSATLALGTVVQNEGKETERASVSWQVLDAEGKIVATAESAAQAIAVDGSAGFTATAKLDDPALWSVDAPNLYTAIVTVEANGKPRDAERISFGVRTAVFDANKGFLLNGKQLKIQGTCNHQDHAGVGAAVPDSLQRFRMGVLREMGCNAVRTSHNMPTPEWVNACDRMGMMMMCETRQMSSSSEGLAQLEAMVKRYRNSPSIILWSIGNEEWQMQEQMAEQGAEVGATMVRRCHELDPTRLVSAAVNGNNKQGVCGAFDIIGFNYQLNLPDDFHKQNPTRAIYGSETASSFYTRGDYTTDPLRNTESAYDVNPANWGETAEVWWTYYATREWEAGGFAWTGFDYRGEPTPYGWPSINSQFGIVVITLWRAACRAWADQFCREAAFLSPRPRCPPRNRRECHEQPNSPAGLRLRPGRLRWRRPGENAGVLLAEGSPENFNPMINTTNTTFDANLPIYNGLGGVQARRYRVSTGLWPNGWEVSPDGKVFIFHLRHGVKWQSSQIFKPTRDFDADDVIFSFERQWKDEQPVPHGVRRRIRLLP